MDLYLINREEGFTKWINDNNAKIGIEIGVRDGTYSEYLLSNTNLQQLYSLDIFIHKHNLINAINSLDKFGDRSIIMQGKSPDATQNFSNDFFDFIYIDADHTYESVIKDLNGWWTKLKTGGLFCGDDYTNLTNPGEGQYGIVQAVNEFSIQHNQKLYVTGTKLNTKQELNRIADNYGKIIEDGLNMKLDIRFGTTYNDDIKIPNWYIIKQ